MPTPYELAFFCSVVYESAEHIQSIEWKGWRHIAFRQNRDSGYFAAAFKKGSEIVISHRGLDIEFLPSAHSVKALIDGENDSLGCVDAKRFSQYLRELNEGATFYETGHSMGGTYATLNAMFFETKAVVFEPIGSDILVRKALRQRYFRIGLFFRPIIENHKKNIVVYLTSPNAVNMLHKHFGTLKRMFVDCVPDSERSTSERIGTIPNIIECAQNIWSNQEENRGAACLDLLQIIFKDSVSYHFKAHSIKNILASFDEKTWHPKMSCEILEWPSTDKDLETLCKGLFKLPRPKGLLSVRRNADYESFFRRELSHFQLGKLVVPKESLKTRGSKREYLKDLERVLESFYPSDQQQPNPDGLKLRRQKKELEFSDRNMMIRLCCLYPKETISIVFCFSMMICCLSYYYSSRDEEVLARTIDLSYKGLLP